MITRYSTPEMTAVWSEENKIASWAEVERAHLKVCMERKCAPVDVIKKFDAALSTKTTADYLRREEETGHDVIAFVAEVGEAMGEDGHHLHRGLTSSDVVDTAFMLRCRSSLEMILNKVTNALHSLKKRAQEHQNTLCMGRTHGIHAEPTTFGTILANFYAELKRAHEHCTWLMHENITGKLSGAVGNYTQWDPEFENSVCAHLKIKPEPVATQVIPRDRFLRILEGVQHISNHIERFALNLRHWARTECGEVLEPFKKKQKGSSAMPHKRNPILSENLCGLARLMRSYVIASSQNVALWHERDISHSSVERVAFSDAFILLDFMLHRYCKLLEGFEVFPERMLQHIHEQGDLWASQSVLTTCVDAGMPRTKAYEIVQKAAHEILEEIQKKGRLESGPDVFKNKLLSDKEITAICDPQKIHNCFSLERFQKNTTQIFSRVFF